MSILIGPPSRHTRLLVTALFLALIAGIAQTSSAQRPRVRVPKGQAETLPRRPNDQVEGTIWEYRSTDYKMPTKPGEPIPEIKGRIRIEGTAVFDASPRVNVKSRGQRESAVKRFARGQGGEVRVPSGAQAKRIGEYRKLSDGKIRFDFNDSKTLHGIMIAWKKKDSNGVWLANYKQREGSKTTGEWLVELRAVKD